MRTKLFIMGLCLTASFLLNAQLKVSSVGNVGNVGIQVGTSTPLSSLAIGDVGFSEWRAYITGPKIALKVQKMGGSPSAGAAFCGIDASTDLISSGPTYNYAVKGVSSSTATVANARSFGVFGSAGYGESGYNYGVYGNFNYTAPGNGAGILGILSTSNVSDVYVPGIYAGYFVGAVKCTSSMTATGYFTSSDKRFKKNIVSMDVTKSINGILALNPVEYNLEQRYIKAHKDTNEIQLPMYDEKSQLFQKKHYGLIAQELQKTYPDLVYEDDNGYLSVNYIGIIPLLIQSVKELKMELQQITDLKDPALVPSKVITSNPLIDANELASLSQNNPNPFSKSTQINYYLPQTVRTANLCIYDLQGKQLKQISISERGAGSQIISGSEFNPGIYLYGLIADGNEVAVKRMILTE